MTRNRPAPQNLFWAALLVATASALCWSGCSAEPAAPNPLRDASDGSAETKPSSPSHTQDALAGQDAGAAPSVHRPADQPNRLAAETSPYLLMHALNPVDWYPWGDEALEKAQRENKVIFLSIGYSSCHWCHVMERESFLDPEIADYLNEHFVCIKVDREERPDIDAIYLMSLQVFNQLSRSGRGGGWPLSMFLTPAGEPFFGGTYFPARDGDRGAATGFLTIIKSVDKNWREQQPRIQQDAELVTRLTKEELDGQSPEPGASIQAYWTGDAIEAMRQRFDSDFGGFSFDPRNPLQPKFPEPSNLVFLLDVLRQDPGNADCEQMLRTSLQRMAWGGIRDHLGGGFHRYSVDRYWKIPHFEKMLYDNAQLASVYAEAARLTGDPSFARAAREILDFVLRELTSPEGGFYSALDAESEGEEGRFYRWEKQEFASLLDDEQYQLFATVYGLDQGPNFESQFYVPQLRRPIEETAGTLGMEPQQLLEKLAPIRAALFERRAQRPRPLTDTKILTAWNGLMIRGFADAGRLLDEPSYVEAASRAAAFLQQNLMHADGRLLRTYTSGQAKLNGYLDDYAFFIDGLIALHRATGQASWLEQADALQTLQNELFWDPASGAYFFTSHDHQSLLARAKNLTDGALPSGNSVAAANLLYLGTQLDRPAYRDQSRQTAIAFSGLLKQFPLTAPRLLVTTQRLIGDSEGRAAQ